MKRVVIGWSSGKDSAWLLHVLQRTTDVEVVALATSFEESTKRVTMHGVPRKLVHQQAQAIGLPLWEMEVPWPCSNEEYERRFHKLLHQAAEQGVKHFAFGDLYLEEIRTYRERLVAGTGIVPKFPIWCGSEGTPALAEAMIAGGLECIVTCIDASVLDRSFLGRRFDESLLQDLPPGVDPCGEGGEFHTFCWNGPMFSRPINVQQAGINEDSRFPTIELTA